MIVLEHWGLGPVSAALLVLGALHEQGRLRLRRWGVVERSRTRRDSSRQAWLFRLGIAWGVVTLVSPLGYWSHELLFARMSLALSFACLVAPLVVLGAPWSALAAGLGLHPRWQGSQAPSARTKEPTRRFVPGGPLVALAAYAGLLGIWQVPGILDPSVGSSALWALELICDLTAGSLLWLQLVGSHPFEPRWDPAARVVLVACSLWVTLIIGVAMVITHSAIYPAFRGGPGTPLSRVMDQGVAGAITWVLPLITLGTAALWCFSEWLRRDEEEWRLGELLEGTRTRALPSSPDVGTG